MYLQGAGSHHPPHMGEDKNTDAGGTGVPPESNPYNSKYGENP